MSALMSRFRASSVRLPYGLTSLSTCGCSTSVASRRTPSTSSEPTRSISKRSGVSTTPSHVPFASHTYHLCRASRRASPKNSPAHTLLSGSISRLW